MSGPAKPPDPATAESSGEHGLAQYLADYLRTADPKVLMIMGPAGAGKSSLLRALVPRVAGPKFFLAYQYTEPAPGPAPTPTVAPPDVPMLLVDPQIAQGDGSRSSPARWSSSLLAFGAQNAEPEPETPSEITEATRRLVEAGGPGSILVDSWDHGSEAFFRAQSTRAECVRIFSAPAAALISMRSAILSTPVHLVLAVSPEAGQALISLADAVVDLRNEEHPVGRVRVASVPKIRGASAPVRAQLYSLEGGHFRSLPGLAPGFRPPVGPPAQDPEHQLDSGWPGSAPFAHAFGRLRHGGVTVIALSPETPETVPQALAVPLAAHVLLQGGRVIWIPAPSIRPSQVAEAIRRFVPAEVIRERLRFKSAGGHDPDIGDLASIELSSSRRSSEDVSVHADARGDAPGRIFPDVYGFMRNRPDSMPTLLVASIEGMRAAALSMGIPVTESLVPVEMSFYSRLPNSHIFAFGSAEDPVMVHVRSAVDTLLQVEMVHGRPVLFGMRPRTSPYLLDWSAPDGSYSLVPVE